MSGENIAWVRTFDFYNNNWNFYYNSEIETIGKNEKVETFHFLDVLCDVLLLMSGEPEQKREINNMKRLREYLDKYNSVDVARQALLNLSKETNYLDLYETDASIMTKIDKYIKRGKILNKPLACIASYVSDRTIFVCLNRSEKQSQKNSEKNGRL